MEVILGMNARRRMLQILLAPLAMVVTALAQTASGVSITAITQNDSISGTVTNAPPDACVVVYVFTNEWYVHPFAKAGSGQSYAMVENGNWTIGTVLRKPTASQVAAVLFSGEPNCDNAPVQLPILTKSAIQGIKAIQKYDFKDNVSRNWKDRL